MTDIKKEIRIDKFNISRIFQFREFFILLIIIIGAIFMSFISPIFLTSPNILAILLGLSIQATVAIGMTILLICGDMDLSVGSTMAFCGVLTCLLFKTGMGVGIAIIIGLALGLLIGLINGLIVTTWNIHPFIVTLGMMSIVRGLELIMAQGSTVVDLPESFLFIGQGKIFGIQSPIIIVIVLVIIFDILVRRSRYFRQGYYIGGNHKAAIMIGIKVRKIRIINFMICSGLAALSGIVMASRLASASVNIGQGLEMGAITASVIGGASLNGGEGTIVGAFIGSLLMSSLINALNIIGVDVYWQNVVTGMILIIAVVFDSVMQNRRERGN